MSKIVLEEIVAKFGGSSVADADLMRHVANIIISHSISSVVLSAPGKRWYLSEDDKITDILIYLHKQNTLMGGS